MFHLKVVGGKCQIIKFYRTELNTKGSVPEPCVLFMMSDRDFTSAPALTCLTLWGFAQHDFICVRRRLPGAQLWTTVPFSGPTEERAQWRRAVTTLQLSHGIWMCITSQVWDTLSSKCTSTVKTLRNTLTKYWEGFREWRSRASGRAPRHRTNNHNKTLCLQVSFRANKWTVLFTGLKIQFLLKNWKFLKIKVHCEHWSCIRLSAPPQEVYRSAEPSCNAALTYCF